MIIRNGDPMRIWTLLAVLIVVASVTMALMQLHPPRHIAMAGGPENGAYSALAQKYRDILARDGIELEIIETAGSVENALLLDVGIVDVAILQGGVRLENPDIEAIGAIFFEPLVFLARSDADVPSNPALWQGLRISSGQSGSGTAAAFSDFQAAVGLDPETNEQLSLPYGEAVSALSGNQIDVAVFVAPFDAPYLTQAYGNTSIKLLSLDHNDAISRRLKYANTVTVPAGAISLNPVLPPTPQTLIALEARLAIMPDLHPALVNRLTMAAIELHSARDIITDPETFPSVEGTLMPINNVARQLILEGPSTWHNWLPYWMAAQVNRLLLLFLPILFILLPLLRTLPTLYAYVMGWRVWQYYPNIREIEEKLDSVTDDSTLVAMDAQLDQLDDQLSRLRVPAAYRQAAYHARMHIDLVRKRIAGMRIHVVQTGSKVEAD
jgi:TRAP-type uncharacterized transport system substrate-binding protein